MASGRSKLFLVNFLLSLATIEVLAAGCDFHLSRNEEGNVTRIEINNKVAIITGGPNSTWRAYLRIGDNMVTTNETGISESSTYTDLPEHQRQQYEELARVPLDGSEISSQSGKLLIANTNGNYLKLKSNRRGTFSVAGNGEFASLHANVGPNPKYTHGSIVTLVDAQCEEIKFVPYRKVDPDLHQLLVDGCRSFWQ